MIYAKCTESLVNELRQHTTSAAAGLFDVLQDYIESENARLEREQQFWAKEIVVKIEYKFCPNLTIIDTPGELQSIGSLWSCALPFVQTA